MSSFDISSGDGRLPKARVYPDVSSWITARMQHAAAQPYVRRILDPDFRPDFVPPHLRWVIEDHLDQQEPEFPIHQ